VVPLAAGAATDHETTDWVLIATYVRIREAIHDAARELGG
jgi:hypothetical protein